jgi:hypothetical protein
LAKNLLRRLLSYGLGRQLTTRDRFVVAELLRQSEANDHRLLDMIVTICKSSLFKGTAHLHSNKP